MSKNNRPESILSNLCGSTNGQEFILQLWQH
ncbi:hypothetical protein CLV24_104158 [Pontibacter ummariensis]|uniref:Uncharacterized protein n=1 Tax=Pontibacter ummariensis TaxID=1610492 RepID=A0A239DCV3_9BACT|nr:hypothetical protein CLV24_104158 [Pontibacter ummariensis]SNS29818.1 hypothetical protein SAMN06296052_104157 [Pontibacter ummariensis]